MDLLSDQLIVFVSQEVVLLVVGAIVSALGLVGTMAMNQLRKKLGAERMAILREQLEPAIERAMAKAKELNLTEAAATEWAASYLERRMTDTIKGLGAKRPDLVERIETQRASRNRRETKSPLAASME